MLDDGYTLEVTRVCTVGDKNASSQLYGAVCRAAKALGYRRVITYTLETEPGTSLRAAGFTEVGRGKGGRSWATKTNGGRYHSTIWGQPLIPEEGRIRWERDLRGSDKGYLDPEPRSLSMVGSGGRIRAANRGE